MVRRLLFFACWLGLAGPGMLQAAGPTWAKVDVAPTKTSIYLGSVSMTMPTFVRQGATYQAAYTAKVFPFAFYNEKGTLTVDMSDAQLQALANGQVVEFTGRAVRTDGAERKVTGKATPKDATTGTLKVRVAYSKRIELIFNTTYRFPE